MDRVEQSITKEVPQDVSIQISSDVDVIISTWRQQYVKAELKSSTTTGSSFATVSITELLNNLNIIVSGADDEGLKLSVTIPENGTKNVVVVGKGKMTMNYSGHHSYCTEINFAINN